MEVILREMESTKVYTSSAKQTTEEDVRRYAAEKLSKKFGLPAKSLYDNIIVMGITKSTQVSINNKMHLVVRTFPIATIAFEDKYREKHPELPAELTIRMEDSDVLVVFDKWESYEIVQFAHKIAKGITYW